MNLEERYNAAPTNTNAGRARTTQAADVGATHGVDFMDAGERSGTVDTMQSNFQRRAATDTTVVQSKDTDTYGQTERKGLSRWFGRALNYAFTDPKAPGNSIQDSVWTMFKRFKGADSWKDSPTGTFHHWTPTTKFSASPELSSLAQTRAKSKSAKTI